MLLTGLIIMEIKTTKEILAESFYEIASKKTAEKITVNDIVKNCGMSPATFYRHFRDKYDLIIWIYGKKCDEIFDRNRNSGSKREEIIFAWVKFCDENKKYLLNLMNNTTGYDSFINGMVEHYVRIYEKSIVDRYGKDVLTERAHLKIYIHASGVIRLMFAWMRGKVCASTEALAESIVEMMPKIVPDGTELKR